MWIIAVRWLPRRPEFVVTKRPSARNESIVSLQTWWVIYGCCCCCLVWLSLTSLPIDSKQTNDISTDKIHLRPPAAEKQFLISPPASPPEGWQPVEEAEPVLNIDLQSALANLLPGSTHELHPPSEHQPAIVVHIAGQANDSLSAKDVIEDQEQDDTCIHEAECSDFEPVRRFQPTPMVNRNIPQTACPPR